MRKIITDVREPFEFEESHVEGAINVPSTQILSGSIPDSLDTDDELVLYCRSGGRAGDCKQYLESKGFTNVTNGINQSEVEAS